MKKIDDIKIGLIVGLIMPIICLFGIQQFNFPNVTFGHWIEKSIEVKTLSTWLKPALAFNIAPFIFFMNLNYLKFCRGMIITTMLYAAVIFYFAFSS